MLLRSCWTSLGRCSWNPGHFAPSRSQSCPFMNLSSAANGCSDIHAEPLHRCRLLTAWSYKSRDKVSGPRAHLRTDGSWSTAPDIDPAKTRNSLGNWHGQKSLQRRSQIEIVVLLQCFRQSSSIKFFNHFVPARRAKFPTKVAICNK